MNIKLDLITDGNVANTANAVRLIQGLRTLGLSLRKAKSIIDIIIPITEGGRAPFYGGVNFTVIITPEQYANYMLSEEYPETHRDYFRTYFIITGKILLTDNPHSFIFDCTKED